MGSGLSVVWLLACAFSWLGGLVLLRLEGLVAVGLGLEELVLIRAASVLVRGV